MSVDVTLSGVLCNCLHIPRNFWKLGVVSGIAARSMDISFAFNLYRTLPPPNWEVSQVLARRFYVTVRPTTQDLTASNLLLCPTDTAWRRTHQSASTQTFIEPPTASNYEIETSKYDPSKAIHATDIRC